MDRKPELNEDDQHDLMRARAGRAGFIAWRMRDVPAIYADLMPTSCDLKELLLAEKCIRAQVDADFSAYQQEQQSPWLQMGPPCALLDSSDLTAQEKIEVGLRGDVPIGLRACPKPGRWNDPEVLAAFEQAKATPEYQAAVEYGKACDAVHEQSRIMREAQATGVDQSTLDSLNADYEAALAKVTELMTAYPKLRNSFNLPLSLYGQPNEWQK